MLIAINEFFCSPFEAAHFIYLSQFNFAIIYPGVAIYLLMVISFPPYDSFNRLEFIAKMRHFKGQLYDYHVKLDKLLVSQIRPITVSDDD